MILVENIDTHHLITIHNSVIQQVGKGKPHVKKSKQQFLSDIKCELIKRKIVSEYVLEYRGRL